MLAPALNDEMGRLVAEALRVLRNKPYQNAMKKRVGIDKEIRLKASPLVVGDEVMCRHGTGILVDFTLLGHPCSVQFTHGPHQHTSKFESARKEKGRGRLQHIPVSFARDGRCTG